MKETEKLFREEIFNKKENNKNARARTGKKGGSHSRKGVRTTYDFLTKKEKRQLNGSVAVKNLFDLLLTKEEFEQYPREKQKEILIHWRNIYPNNKIMAALEIKSNGGFKALMDRLEVPKKREFTKEKKPKQLAASMDKSKGDPEPMEVMPAVLETADSINILSGLLLNYNGVYKSDEIVKILTKLQLILEGEENPFVMSISLQEKR